MVLSVRYYDDVIYVAILWYDNGVTVTTLTIKISEGMDSKINDFLESHPYYMNKSEMVRDAIRHLIEEESNLSEETLRVIEKGKEQVEKRKGKTLEEVEQELDD